LGKDGMKEWTQVFDEVFDKDQMLEVKGIAKALGKEDSESIDLVRYQNMLYEVASPTACSAVLWAAKNGTVYHGRNMDYAFHFDMPDGRTLNWPDVTFDATFVKNKKPLFRSTMWPGQIGIATGMRYGGWAFQQNTRPGNDWQENLKAAKKGGKAFTLEVRKLAESTDDFHAAVDTLKMMKFMAPMYFTLSGPGAFEGAVISVDRLGERLPETPPVQKLEQANEHWHLVQTNDDITKFPMDPRRPVADAMLKGAKQEVVNEENLMQFMHTPILYNGETVFSTVMVPASGYYKTTLPDEPPFPKDGLVASRGGSGALPNLGPDSMKKRKAFYKSLGKLATDYQKGGTLAAMGDLAALKAFMAPSAKKAKAVKKAASHTKQDAKEESACHSTHALLSLVAVLLGTWLNIVA